MYDFREQLLSKTDESSQEAIDNYLLFLSNCKISSYTERHHVLPRCLFPEFKSFTKQPWNIVNLSARDHFIAHHKLYRIFPHNFKIMLACQMMRFGRKLEENLLEEMALEYEQMKIKMNEHQKNQVFSDETRQKLRVAQKKKYEDPKERMKCAVYGRVISEENREKLRVACSRPKTEAHKQKLRDKVVTDEARVNMSLAQKKRYERTEEREIARAVNKGRKHTEKARNNMREGQLKRLPATKETREKLSKASTGRSRSDETKVKLSVKAMERNIGRKWMNKDNSSKFVPPNDIELLLSQGWKLGRK